MHILHVYEVGTALNNKETVLDQEHHSTAPNLPKKCILGSHTTFRNFSHEATQNATGVKKNFPKYFDLSIFVIALIT